MNWDVSIQNMSIGDGGIIGLIGVLLGFFLNSFWGYLTIKNENKAHKKAILEEVKQCAKLSKALLEDNVLAPSYKLPTEIYRNSFPILMKNKALNKNQIECLQSYYIDVESLNRGIEINQLLWIESQPSGKEKIKSGHERNKLKSERLKEDGEYYKNLLSCW